MTSAPLDGVARSAAHVHVLRGDPDEAELAALVAGIVAARQQDAPGGLVSLRDDDAPAWSDRSRSLRGPGAAPSRAGDAWRWSLHP
ncbi:acyl-CoA carboxylase subunit epsilon [Cellulomonas chengniuliangii]|uniref:Acyl-CoA carboxylase subunit epsilon n=1 Tax=Cellulomonas chengniuliangii TaxID=2968084 RepID=A0ABY5L3D0_9CELL|nr:acyl-CoA carboxylase subunit epsilon [Cellulomonas chengniuliangii]MCC2310140.1 acyl-CoA carboxylase subunit epsilon [Cellulomonas chengniuliangii]MCC2316379.1 acyl-CoA carboxylase subunit epsilon [Cellulomonas chengniuliangii]UUI76196.1 acyl-CoA carboxylase subunit epsilon [Cellulomonas chengniuliangii]